VLERAHSVALPGGRADLLLGSALNSASPARRRVFDRRSSLSTTRLDYRLALRRSACVIHHQTPDVLTIMTSVIK